MENIIWLRVWVVSLILSVSVNGLNKSEPPEKECLPNDAGGCTCKFTDGTGIVDLTSLGNADGTPRFKDVKQPDGEDTFSYSACLGFTEGKCQDAAVCLTSGSSGDVQLGDAGRTMFEYEEESGNVVAAYTCRGSVLMVSEVELVCDPSACEPTLTPKGQASVGNYKFVLTSVCACPNLCTDSGPTHCSGSNEGLGGSFSVGTIILIGFVSLLLVYITGGIIYTKVKLKASGSDVIPNKELWTSLPGMIKDGIMFSFGKCTPKKRLYEQK